MQTFQILEGSLREGGSAKTIRDARLNRAQVRFSIGNDQYAGEVTRHIILNRRDNNATPLTVL